MGCITKKGIEIKQRTKEIEQLIQRHPDMSIRELLKNKRCNYTKKEVIERLIKPKRL